MNITHALGVDYDGRELAKLNLAFADVHRDDHDGALVIPPDSSPLVACLDCTYGDIVGQEYLP